MKVYRKVIKPMVKKHNVRKQVREFIQMIKRVVDDLRDVLKRKQRVKSK